MSSAHATSGDTDSRDMPTQPGRLRPPESPAASSAWLLRTSALAAVAAAAMGVIVAPGMRGNASEPVVVKAEEASAILAYFLMGLLVALVLRGATELVRAHAIALGARVAMISGGAMVVAICVLGLKERLAPPWPVALGSASAAAAIAAAYSAARGPHTRAIAGVLFAFALAAVARLAAWELAMRAGDTANVTLFMLGRGFATAGVVLEASGQLLAVTWLGTRGRVSGQLGATVALAGAFALTWGVARGMHSDAAPWQSVLHTALADAPGVPAPFRLETLATFLVPAALLFALVAAAQPNQVVAIVASMALALVSRGSFDAPLRALCVIAAAQWTALACVDSQAMWRTLIADRKRRTEDEAVAPRQP
jgi:hypothetical protein